MLTRPRRQVAATFALALFTIAPTIYVGVTVHLLRQPSHARTVEAEIGRRLGVLVSVDSATHPRPDVDSLLGVSLRLDDAGHAEIARADTLRIGRDGSDMTLKVGTLKLTGDGASDALSTTVTLMRRLASAEASRISLVADRCDVRLGGRIETLTDLVAVVQVDRSAPTLTASYVLAGDSPKGDRRRCEMAVRCEAGPGGGSTYVAFKTMDGPVSATVLSPFFDVSDWLGADARMEGALDLSRDGSGSWDLQFRGDLTRLDLANLVGRRFAGHRLNGEAKLSVGLARWGERPGAQGPGWVEARGVITSGPGSISSGLLKSLGSRMRFRLSDRAILGVNEVEFQGLGLSFAMNASGELVLRGGLGSEYARDAVIVQGDNLQPLARAPEGAANVRGLWNALIPSSPETLAPLVPEGQALRALPLPPGRSGRMSAN